MQYLSFLLSKIGQPAEVKKNKDWWHHILPLLSLVKTNGKASEYLSNLRSEKPDLSRVSLPVVSSGATIEVPGYMGKMKVSQLFELIKFINSTKRSDLVQSQTKSAEISVGTPWPMYAHKFTHNFNYESWDKDDEWLSYMLGDDLKFLLEYKDWELPWDLDYLSFLRTRATTVKSTGAVVSPTSYKMVSTGDAQFDELPRVLKFMLIQTWVFHPTIRKPGAMILNWNDWDALPTYSFDDVQIDADPEKVQELDTPW